MRWEKERKPGEMREIWPVPVPIPLDILCRSVSRLAPKLFALFS
jgi:hypothetical protein